MALTGAARMWVWGTAVVTGLATVGLALLAALADPDTTAQAVGLVGAVVGMAGLLVSVITLFRSSSTRSPNGRRVRGGRGAIAAGGDIVGSALGKNSKVTGPRTASSSTRVRRTADDVQAGRDGIATGGDIIDSALGEGSER